MATASALQTYLGTLHNYTGEGPQYYDEPLGTNPTVEQGIQHQEGSIIRAGGVLPGSVYWLKVGPLGNEWMKLSDAEKIAQITQSVTAANAKWQTTLVTLPEVIDKLIDDDPSGE